jgi:hypothetical protein
MAANTTSCRLKDPRSLFLIALKKGSFQAFSLSCPTVVALMTAAKPTASDRSL